MARMHRFRRVVIASAAGVCAGILALFVLPNFFSFSAAPGTRAFFVAVAATAVCTFLLMYARLRHRGPVSRSPRPKLLLKWERRCWLPGWTRGAIAVSVFLLALAGLPFAVEAVAGAVCGPDWISRAKARGVPESLALAGLLGLATALAYLIARYCHLRLTWKRVIAGSDLCLNCGYNLTGNASGVCPECGENI